MTPLENVNQMLDFKSHIKKLQHNIETCKNNDNNDDAKYWQDCLKEILKVRQNIEVKIAKERAAGNGA